MIAGVKPYPEMKASGVDWLGEVPEHWEVLPNRAVYEEVKERDRPEETMLSVTITQGVIHQQTLLSGSSKKDSSNPNKAAYKARSTRRNRVQQDAGLARSRRSVGLPRHR